MMRAGAYIIAGLTALLAIAPTQAQQAGDIVEQLQKRSERILYGFVPDVDNLRFIGGEELRARYEGLSIKGIYNITPHTDQRYVEHFSADGKTRYTEGEFSSRGTYYIKGDLLCFRYDEIPEEEHCGYEFDYGDCIISYSRYALIIGGKPANPAGWSSVNKPTHKDFSWDNLSLEEAKDFSCYSLIS